MTCSDARNWQGQEIFLFSKTLGPVLWPTQPPIHLIPGFFPGSEEPDRQIHHPPPSSARVKAPYKASWRAQGQLYLYVHMQKGLVSTLGANDWIRKLFFELRFDHVH
jgi:hypothetical protein